MVTRLNALLWLQTLCLRRVQDEASNVEGLPDIPLNEIAVLVGKKIEPFNAIYQDK